jgi:Transglutaminase-like superfamily
MASLHGRIAPNEPRSASGNAPADVRRTRWAVEAAARHLPVSLPCLPQALAAAWMLQSRGHAPSLLYGVAPHGFEAHAWVELEGMPVVGHRAAAGFTVLARFPGGASR